MEFRRFDLLLRTFDLGALRLVDVVLEIGRVWRTHTGGQLGRCLP